LGKPFRQGSVLILLRARRNKKCHLHGKSFCLFAAANGIPYDALGQITDGLGLSQRFESLMFAPADPSVARIVNSSVALRSRKSGPMTNTRRKKIYEGKAKILYEGPEPGTLIQYFKDDATAFNAQKKAVLDGKGVINNRISEFVMTKLTNIGVQNHFIKRLNLREQLIREVEIIPLEVVCRNVVAGSMAKRFGLPEGQQLPRSIIEFYYKNDALEDPMVTEEHVTAFNWANTQEIDDILAMTLRVNDFLSGMFAAVGITLVDFKIEYGRLFEGEFSRVILADEISPDSCRLWDAQTNEKLDKDRFRRDMGNVIESYAEVAKRLGIMGDMPKVIEGGMQ
jgi:phosphoribosylaminoimidazole-succinocarboxamide synthase